MIWKELPRDCSNRVKICWVPILSEKSRSWSVLHLFRKGHTNGFFGLLGGSSEITSGHNNHGDRKSPKYGKRSPSKWPNFMAYKSGVILTTYPSPGMIRRASKSRKFHVSVLFFRWSVAVKNGSRVCVKIQQSTCQPTDELYWLLRYVYRKILIRPKDASIYIPKRSMYDYLFIIPTFG